MKNLTIYETAELLNVTHTTIYNKLNNKAIYKDLKKFIVKDGKQRLIKPEGIEELKKHINLKGKFTENLESEPSNQKQEATESHYNSMFESLLKELQEQLKIKDKQIEALQEALLREQEINKNNQVLSLNNKPFLLENDTKKPFWRKFFD